MCHVTSFFIKSSDFIANRFILLQATVLRLGLDRKQQLMLLLINKDIGIVLLVEKQLMNIGGRFTSVRP